MLWVLLKMLKRELRKGVRLAHWWLIEEIQKIQFKLRGIKMKTREK